MQAPAGPTTRPTSDRVKEATFNALHSLGAVEGATVLDLFAGSGAMGIEALSRGAVSATFVDEDPQAIEAVRANLRVTGLEGRAEVVRADALTYLSARVPSVDLAVLDPPYGTDDEGWAQLLGTLVCTVAVLESDQQVVPGPGWEVLRVRRYGGTVVTLARHEHRLEKGKR